MTDVGTPYIKQFETREGADGRWRWFWKNLADDKVLGMSCSSYPTFIDCRLEAMRTFPTLLQIDMAEGVGRFKDSRDPEE